MSAHLLVPLIVEAVLKVAAIGQGVVKVDV
jgi:hypothetical protein